MPYRVFPYLTLPGGLILVCYMQVSCIATNVMYVFVVFFFLSSAKDWSNECPNVIKYELSLFLGS